MGIFSMVFGDDRPPVDAEVEGLDSDIRLDMSKLKKVDSTITVSKGDTLSKLAKAHGTTVAELAKLNHIRDVNKINTGQKLVLPGKAAAPTTQKTGTPTVSDGTSGGTPATPEAVTVPPISDDASAQERAARLQSATGLVEMPSNVKAFVNDLVANTPAGGLAKTEHGNEMLNEREKLAVIELIKSDPAFRAGKERGAIQYNNYTDGFAGVRFKEDLTEETFKDPGRVVKTTLGQFTWERLPNGTLRVIDRYNFNDAEELQEANPTVVDKVANLIEFMGEDNRGDYGLARRIGGLFGSVEGEGAEVQLFLNEDGTDAERPPKPKPQPQLPEQSPKDIPESGPIDDPRRPRLRPQDPGDIPSVWDPQAEYEARREALLSEQVPGDVPSPAGDFVAPGSDVPAFEDTPAFDPGDTPPPEKVVKVTVTVQRGDTLSKIARAAGTTVAAIVEKNGLKDANQIRVGQELEI